MLVYIHFCGHMKYFFFFFLIFIYLFIFYLFMAVLGLRFCARAFSSCGKRGPLFIAVRGPLTIAASLVAEHRLSNCGSRAQLLCSMWDLPRPGLEPVSPALAGRFSTTAPPGKPMKYFFRIGFFFFLFGCAVQHAGSQFPDQGSNPCPLQWKHRVLTIGPPANSLGQIYTS